MTNEISFAKPHIGLFDCISEGWQLIKADYWLFLGITIVAIIVAGAVPFYILMGPMHCGIYFSLRKKMRGGRVEFGDAFKGFDFFGRSLVATLISFSPMLLLSALAVVSILPGIFADAARGVEYEMPPLVMIMLFVEIALAYLIFIVIQGLTMFIFPIIIETNLGAWDAIKLSSRAVWHNAWGITLLLLGQGLLALLGFICCFVGVYFVMPVMFASVMVAYRRIFGLSPSTSAA